VFVQRLDTIAATLKVTEVTEVTNVNHVCLFCLFVCRPTQNVGDRNGNGQREWIKGQWVKGKESALLWFVLASCGGFAAAAE
jgi:hypothetical protein